MARSSTAHWRIGDRWFVARYDRIIDCSRPLAFDDTDASLFGAGFPGRNPLVVDDWIGRVGHGAPVNVDRLDLVPHCHGTHTETAGHLTREPLHHADLPSDGPVPSTLATVGTVRGDEAAVEAGPACRPSDRVITADRVRDVLDRADPAFLEGLVLRTREFRVADAHPTYLTAPAAGILSALGIMHLVLELPSIDRPEDGARLAAHRAWWQFGDDRPGRPAPGRRLATLTELAVLPPHAADGCYLLDLHTPSMRTDAVPSRPLLIPVEAVERPR